MEEIDNGISDEILVRAQKELSEFLEKNNIPKSQKVMLEMQGYFLLILTNDHKKTSKMYIEYQKRQERLKWWDRLQWVIVPIVAGGTLAFLWQAVIFWFELVPKLSQLP